MKTRNSKLHVLFLPSFYMDPEKPVLGIFFKEQAQALKREGVEVGVAYVEPRRLRAFRLANLKENHGQISSRDEDGLPTMRLHGWNPLLQTFLGGLIWTIATRMLVNQYIKRFGRPDIIHAHNAYWAGYSAYGIWKRTNIPYVITEHSSRFLLRNEAGQPRWACRLAYQNASRVLVVSNAMGRSIVPLMAEKRYDVVPNCVDSEYFTLPPIQSANNKFVFLAIAHLSRNKGFDYLLRAFASKFKKDDQAILKIGGGGAIRDELVSLCNELKILDKVQFLGALTKTQVREAMWEADVFVLTSIHETFGVVLIEAMATGLPVIATKSGGPNEIVTDDMGLLVEAGNVDALADAMHDLRYRQRFDREKIRSEAISRYGFAAFASKMSRIYTEVLNRIC